MPNNHFSLFKTFIDRKRGVALLLNPKVMTTFTRRFLTDGVHEFHGKIDPSEGRYRFFKNARRFPMAPIKDYLHFRFHTSEYAIYAFVRNPYSRTFSAWKDKFYDGHTRFADGRTHGYTRSMQAGELKAARKFCKKNGLEGGSEGELVTFDSFIQYLVNTPAGKRNQHWDQQALILQQPEVPLMGVFSIESQLETGFKTVANVLDFNEVWAVSRLSHKANASSLYQGNNPYTKELAELVYQASKPDFDMFGYTQKSYLDLW